ncbi:HCLS1-associated protein X-1-like isoform X2 [Mytilus californianus]|uniref:HCLS1-associated protein X-1-like isoform X2 n=1 Tax=Mytilus californianus TaxID=6549 RepID=UPI00224764C5|nr:HCLS1-associated protein X-1-like isoform X2 [Mytilus californianus]
MSINDFFKSFFGFNRTQEHHPFSRENIWDEDGNDEEDDHGMFFFHFDLNRQMESMQREMEDMFRNFGAVEFFPGSQHPEVRNPQNPRDLMLKGNEHKEEIFMQPRQPFAPESRTQQNPRDQMLKDNEEKKESKPYFIQPFTPFRSPFSPRLPATEKREDSDVDGKLGVDDVAKLFDSPKSQPEFRMEQPKTYSYNRSFSFTTSRGPDGRVEQRKTVRDGDGNEEVTVTRSIGDQSHSFTIKKDKSGVEEKIENFKNMDEKDMNKFNRTWKSQQQPSLPESKGDQMIRDNHPDLRDNIPVIKDSTDASLFHKFFNGWFKPKKT